MEFVRFAEIALFFCLNLRDTVIKKMTAAHPAMTNREESVAKALRLLDLLMEAHQPLTLAALSEQTGWLKSTIHGLLSTMRESAVVDRQSDGRYCLGVRLFEYGCAVGASWSVSDLAKPHLQHLASVTGQSVFLSMSNRSEVITIEQVQSRVGLRVVSCRTLEPYTPKTLVTWEEFFRVM